MKRNTLILICTIIFIIHFISTFFLKEDSRKKLFLNNYIGKKYKILNDKLYDFSKKCWYIKQVLIILENIIFLGLSIDTFLFSAIIASWLLIDQCLRIIIIIYGKKYKMLRKN